MPLTYTEKQFAKLSSPAKPARTDSPGRKAVKKATVGVREQDIQNAILDYLSYRGIFAIRLNSGAIKTERGSLVRGCPAGTPDILSIVAGRAVFIEVKRPGKQPTAIQEAMHQRLRQSGAVVLVATCIEDVEAAL